VEAVCQRVPERTTDAALHAGRAVMAVKSAGYDLVRQFDTFMLLQYIQETR
jgi:hypothetical protein